jgi:cell division septal protein FtsQ
LGIPAERLQRRTVRQGLVKKRKRRLMRRLRDLASVVMAGFLAYGTYWLWGSPVWHWQGQMSVAGNRLVSKQEILARLDVPQNTALYRLNPQWVSDQVKGIPAVSRVAVRRWLFPPRLEVTVLERQPLVAVLGPGQSLWMDQEGVVFPANPKLVTPRFPVKIETQLRVGERLAPAVQSHLFEVLETWPKGAGGRIDLRKADDIYATVDGWPLRLGAVTDVPTKFGMFAHLRPLAQKYKDRLQYIDLRFPTSPTFKLQSGDTIDASKAESASGAPAATQPSSTPASPGPTTSPSPTPKPSPSAPEKKAPAP